MHKLTLTLLLLLLFSGQTFAHDKEKQSDWVGDGKYRSKSGELCCGLNDCEVVPSDQVVETLRGFDYFFVSKFKGRIFEGSVPHDSVLESEDSNYWACTVGTRLRCFFAPTKRY